MQCSARNENHRCSFNPHKNVPLRSNVYLILTIEQSEQNGTAEPANLSAFVTNYGLMYHCEEV